jgi:hypothetical protein
VAAKTGIVASVSMKDECEVMRIGHHDVYFRDQLELVGHKVTAPWTQASQFELEFEDSRSNTS